MTKHCMHNTPARRRWRSLPISRAIAMVALAGQLWACAPGGSAEPTRAVPAAQPSDAAIPAQAPASTTAPPPASTVDAEPAAPATVRNIDRDTRSVPASHALPASGAVTLPTTDCGTYFVVQAMVNGKGPYNFVLDTGATHTAITPRLARELGANVQSIEGVVRGASGARSQAAGVCTIESFGAGGFVASDFDAIVLDLRAIAATFGVRIDGILGYPVFDGVLLTVDYPGRAVRVERGRLPSPDGKQVIPLLRRDAPYIRANVGDRSVRLLIDTGKTGGLAIDGLESYSTAAPPTPIGSATGIAGTYIVRAARLRDDVTAGALVLERPIAVEGQGSSMLGAASLKGLVLTFDPRNRRARVAPPSGEREARVSFPGVRGIGLGFKYERGSWLVGSLFENSPAAAAGVQENDLPIRINGRRLSDLKCMRIEELYADDTVELEIVRGFRDRQKITVPVSVVVP